MIESERIIRRFEMKDEEGKTKEKYGLKRFAKQLRIGKGYACETYGKGIKLKRAERVRYVSEMSERQDSRNDIYVKKGIKECRSDRRGGRKRDLSGN